ncbi:23S rRNA (pseudouridine1915-N3)-methyltransferase [Capnocytophaga haemolytica]|jgi:ribosomal RNA large subunit methyltransferase H|uniref:Ribosomal RNA large subunit methyltransferase H n=1 Tax=Capnocytophaga haemolytica TaxID=45243 RepID=A0AAX2GW76_9FLAO|nr:23S rRNA (pseudouridine(1915)-N(3))-methyltransferase RlmH [Capnocytophaga haemolytica]AMD84929.1 50S rRNA methyltransferase [Capnocytophaga haemolytica]SFO32229.1 23S rRNA (pseudouridine1915-N3)-methyltransferase [Capnocytophaga haemolytica]SNV06345.1 Ribosomal RNA large subunit methyltransferase H [Capnocytophaga haemolytica]
MNIKLIAVGKTDQAALQALINEYQKRLSRYAPFDLQVITDVKNSKSLSEEQQKVKEGELILKSVASTDYLVLLDERGKEYTSVEFSAYIQKVMLSGSKQMTFVIGGPYGFSEAVYRRADAKVALSKLTFSHQMVRLFFVEQLYRAFTILKNEPYHHQ